MQQYWVPRVDWQNERVIIRAADAHHILHVMRRKVGDRVRVFDGRGRMAEVELTDIHGQTVIGSIIREERQTVRHRWVICPALLKGEKMDWLMQKSTELGATDIYPLSTEHAVVRLSADKEATRRARFQKIVKEAAEQSARWWLPEVYPLYTPGEWLDEVWPELHTAGGVLMVAASSQDAEHIGIRPRPLAAFITELKSERPYIVCVGPEGGFSAREMTLFHARGAQMIALGRRPLRAETATLAVLSYFLMLTGMSEANEAE